MGGGLAAGSFFLGGQLQGAQAAQAYQQQMQDRALQMELNRALMIGKLQQMNQTNQAYQNLPEDERNYLLTHGTHEGYQKGETTKANAQSYIDQVKTWLTDPKLTPQQRNELVSSAVSVAQNPDSVGQQINLMRLMGFGQKPDKPSDYDKKLQEFRERPGEFAAMAAAGRQPQKPEAPDIKIENIGTARFEVARDKFSGQEIWRRPAGFDKPSATALNSLAESKKTALMLQGIPDLLSKVDPHDHRTLFNQARLYVMDPRLRLLAKPLYGELDSNYDLLFNQLGQVQGGLSRSYMGGKPSQYLFKTLSKHFPSPGDTAQVITDKTTALLGPNSVLKANEKVIDDMYHLTPEDAAEAESGGGSPMLAPPAGGAAPSPSSTSPGVFTGKYSKSHRKLVRRSDGNIYEEGEPVW